MNKLFFLITGISLLWLLFSCNQENKSVENQVATSVNSTTQDVWAEQIESNTSLVKPEGWADEDWKLVNKNVEKEKIFNTIFSSVMSGKQKAYDFFTDSIITVDLLNERIGQINGSAISSIRTREKWNFDKEKFKMEKQITRIYLFTPKLDENGEYLGDKALFYVKLNN